MFRLAVFSLRNRSLIALVTVVAALFGVLAAGGLKQELIPSVQFPQLAVVSTYQGATPTVVEQRVSLPIEQAIRGVTGLESTTSRSTTGSSTVSASFTYGTDLDQAEQKIGSAINRIRAGLPDGVDPEVVSGSLADFPVIQLAVSGDSSSATLAQSVTDTVLTPLSKLAGVRAADLSGEPGQRVTVTPKAALSDHRLQPTVIDDTLKASGVLVPAGTVTANGSTRSIQIGTELGSTADIAALPLVGVSARQYYGPTSSRTAPPTIGDVATVATGRDPVTTVSLVDGRPALTIAITKLPDANTVDVSREVRAALPALRADLGAGGAFTVVFDQAPYIQQSIDSLAEEGALGLAFAIVVILLFLLSVRTTIVTAISIPTSVLLTFIGMQAAGYTLNILTLGAITIAIGRVVDDSIVVTENIARHEAEEQPATPAERAASILTAVREVAGAVTASTVTTVAVFLPLAFVGGTTGELFRPFALTVTLALGSSLFVALTIVPVLASWFLRPSRRAAARAKRTPLLQRVYRPVLAFTLRFRKTTVGAALLVLVGTGALLPLLSTNYLGSSGQNTLTVTQTVADGESLDAQTVTARSVDAALRGIRGVSTVATSIGTSGSSLRDAFESGTGTQITYSITTSATADQDALQRTIRSRLDAEGPASSFQVTASQGLGQSSDIEVDVTAGSAASLQRAADAVLARMRALSEITQASSDLSASQQYLAVDIDAAKAATAGYSEVALAQLVARSTQPTDIGAVTIGDDDLTVYLVARDPVTTVGGLKALSIPTPTGDQRLDALASVRRTLEAPAISTEDARRSATVTATPAGSNTGAASAAVTRAVAQLHLPAGASASIGGVASDQTTAFQQLGLALLAAILIVYTVMVATFRSLRQPLELLVSVPFAATGAIGLQLISGIPLGVASFIGLVMLVGIVVTNAIVLIDLVNQYRERGLGVREAVMEGATRRLRPILMTALATILALVPTATGLTGTGGFISQPLAIVVIGGLVSSTVLTLLVLPTLYWLIEGRRDRRPERLERRAARRGRRRPRPSGGPERAAAPKAVQSA